MRAVILMDDTSVEPRIEQKASEFSEAMRQADLHSFDIEQQFARARMGDTNAFIGLLAFGRNIEAANSPGFGKSLLEILSELGDTGFSNVLATQPLEVRICVSKHLAAGVANTKVARLQRPISEAFPLTYAVTSSSN
jgi:hypothetical protein